MNGVVHGNADCHRRDQCCGRVEGYAEKPHDAEVDNDSKWETEHTNRTHEDIYVNYDNVFVGLDVSLCDWCCYTKFGDVVVLLNENKHRIIREIWMSIWVGTCVGSRIKQSVQTGITIKTSKVS